MVCLLLTASLTTTQDPLLNGDIYYLQFFGNVGDFRQPSINKYMRYSERPTLTSNSNKNVFTKVWTNGQQGSNVDYFARHCAGYVHMYVCMYVYMCFF